MDGWSHLDISSSRHRDLFLTRFLEPHFLGFSYPGAPVIAALWSYDLLPRRLRPFMDVLLFMESSSTESPIHMVPPL